MDLYFSQRGQTVIEPLQPGEGWWAGASSAVWDKEHKCFYLYYRLRRPRELGRGTDCRVACGCDGLHFEDIWEATKDDFHAQSVEKASLVKTPEGRYRRARRGAACCAPTSRKAASGASPCWKPPARRS